MAYDEGQPLSPFKPPPVPVWQAPLDLSLRQEALEASFRIHGDGSGDDEYILETAEAILKFLRAETNASQ